MMQAWTTVICFLNKGDIWLTFFENLCLKSVYVFFFYICAQTNLMDFEEFCGFMTFVWNK